MIILLVLLWNTAAASTSTAVLHLQGVVPRILKTSVLNNKLVIEHNFPIDLPDTCVIVNTMKMICTDLNITIVTLE